MEHDTKTRKSASFAFSLVCELWRRPLLRISTRQHGLLYARLEERMLTFACYAICSPFAHGGQELVRVLLRSRQMAHNHGMTPSARLQLGM
jgi:hypothetical protein